MGCRACAQLWAYIIICYRKWGEKYASITPLFRGPSAISAARRRRNKSWRRAGKTPQRWRWWPRNRKKNGAQTITQLWKNLTVNIFCVNYTFAINTARLRLRFTYTVGSKLCFFGVRMVLNHSALVFSACRVFHVLVYFRKAINDPDIPDWRRDKKYFFLIAC